MTTTIHTTLTAGNGWAPDLPAFTAVDIIPDALVLKCSTIAGAIEGDEPIVPVIYIDDASAAFVAEGDPIDVSDPGLNAVPVRTGKVAQLVKVSREMFSQENAAEQLANSVARAVTVKANQAFLTQPAPTPPAVAPAPGLLNVDGIIEGDPVTAALDPLIDLLAELEANGASPTHMILAPDTWAALRKLKTATDSNASLLGAGVTDSARMLLDVPVITSPAMAEGHGLVLDKSAIVSAVGPIHVATSEHAHFDSDVIAVRCTWRFGQNVVKPNRLGFFTVETGIVSDESSSSS